MIGSMYDATVCITRVSDTCICIVYSHTQIKDMLPADGCIHICVVATNTLSEKGLIGSLCQQFGVACTTGTLDSHDPTGDSLYKIEWHSAFNAGTR